MSEPAVRLLFFFGQQDWNCGARQESSLAGGPRSGAAWQSPGSNPGALYRGVSVAPLCFSWCDGINTLEGKIILSFLNNLSKIQVQPEKLKLLEGFFCLQKYVKGRFSLDHECMHVSQQVHRTS